MYRTKLEKIEHDSEFFRPVRLGFWYWNTGNNRMIDTEYTSFDESEMTPYFYGGTGKMDIRYGESKTLAFKNTNGTPLVNKSITLTTPDDNHTQPLQTDADGRVTFDLLTVRHYKYGNSQEHDGVSGVPLQTDYRQYVFGTDGYRPYSISLTQLKNSDVLTMEES
jgi:hypothetical protein